MPMKKTKKTAPKPAAKKTSKKVITVEKCPAPEQARFIGLGEAFYNFFKGYFDFRGTSTRAEYWWMVLIAVVLTSLPNLIFLAIFITAIIIPFVMLTIRRMHDIGKSGWHFYGVEIGGTAVSYALAAISKSLMIKTVAIVANSDGIEAEAVELTATTLSSIFQYAASAVMLFVVVYCIVLLLLPSKLENNKYRQKI